MKKDQMSTSSFWDQEIESKGINAVRETLMGKEGSVTGKAIALSIYKFEEKQKHEKHEELKKLNQGMLDSQMRGNNIQKGVLIVLLATLFSMILIAFFKA